MVAATATSTAAEIVLTQKKRLKFSGEFVAAKQNDARVPTNMIANLLVLS